MSGDSFGYHSWKADTNGIFDRARMLLSILRCTGQLPTTKNYQLQNINSTEGEKHGVDQLFPNLSTHQNQLEDLLKHQLQSPTSEILNEQMWGGA
jgi:hypothetical protein